MRDEFKNLFTPLQIGPVTVPNRIFMSGGNPRFFPGTAPPSDRAIHYWEARAAGGAGLIITSGHNPFSSTTASPPSAYESDDVIPVLRRVADTIHRYGTKCFGQLSHLGNSITGRSAGGGATWAASPVYRRNLFAPALQEIGYEMVADEIKRTVRAYAAAAFRFKEAGYDGLELRALFGMLEAQFLSPVMNIRTDEYGGSLENRMRFLLETVDAVRGAVGSDFAVGIRFTGDEFLDRTWWSKERGNTLEEGKKIAKILEATGQLDYLFPCAGTIGPLHIPAMYYPLGSFVYLAAELKKLVNLPVFCTGRINDPVMAEEILSNHQADMIGMYRGLVADPELPIKALEGRAEEIRRCVGCNEGCVGSDFPRLPLSCTVNVRAGREKDFVMEPSETPKKVLVIGGGGAGLEAARVAALRGHRVSLYEKENTLTRDLTIASRAPGREGWKDVLRYYGDQMKRLQVDVHLEVLVTPEMVEEMIRKEGYEAVVVATGAKRFIPEVPGMAGSKLKIAQAREVLDGEVEAGESVLMVAYEHHSVALTTADFLAELGKKVEVITDSLFAGGQLDNYTKETIYTRLLERGVTITPLTGLKEIRGNTLFLHNVLTGVERKAETVDTVIFATDGRPEDSLYRFLKGKVKELYRVGQCVSPRRLLDSIFDGALVGKNL